MRVAAAERALATATPTETEEIWRYSRMGELDLDRYEVAGRGRPVGAPDAGIAAAVSATKALIPDRAAFVMVVDGQIVVLEVDDALPTASFTSVRPMTPPRWGRP